MFTELGHTCISQGTYNDPKHLGADAARPARDLPYFPELNPLAKLEWVTHIDTIPQKLIDWCDMVYILGISQWLPVNWERIKHKKVIWRSIGQSEPHTERIVGYYRTKGLRVVRYSPLERLIQGYAGHDAVIRFYKDEEEYNGWNGESKMVVTVAQSMKFRNDFLRYDVFEAATRGLPRGLYGKGNEEKHEGMVVDELVRGELTYEELKSVYRNNRVFFYTCTRPAPYTMGFMEAWMTGIPVVAIGAALAGYFVETPMLIERGKSGFVADSIGELNELCRVLLNNDKLAREISEGGRKAAIEHFGYPKIKAQWKEFFDSL
jgi:glycosyltransferase involved in cell wall biosynthesis